MPRNKLYLGKAGQFVAMSEFLVRGWNVAIPEVDIGDDIFVVRDETGDFVRVQVKTSNVKTFKNNYGVQFRLSHKQLQQTFTPDLLYILVVRYTEGFNKFIIIKRDELLTKVQLENVGSISNDYLQLYFSINKNTWSVTCNSKNFTQYVNDFQLFPKIDHDLIG